MGRLKISKESLEYQVYPAGEYVVEMGGFKPKFAGSKQSINLNPILRIKNHPALSGKTVFFNANTGASFLLRDFCHAAGMMMVGETPEMASKGEAGDFEFPPGDFLNFDPQKPENWKYAGPLLGKMLKIELVERQSMKKDQAGNLVPVPNQTRNEIKRFFCAIQGCGVAHKENLIR